MADKAGTSVNWGMLCHLGGLAMYIGIPVGNIIVPLVIWLLKKESDTSVASEGREAINFNISFTIYALVAGLLCYVLIGFIALPVVLVAHIILVIQAVLKVNKGESVRYPFTLRVIN